MSRLFKALSVTYTYSNANNASYKLVRRVNDVRSDATDQQILAIGQAYAKLLPGDQLTQVIITEQNAVQA
ncbi:hypothetical protein [Lacticaseibacillus brantae]|uniref:DUF1659 domain-containing protein n=1 Tax=Lacticaseibacillus brantae DSM 23927 TaxID=1423727 RepID=A0A0R2AZZ4_9LACO|nr:hypothetical protein [Lacticaseibacillus brantae]KRM72426.1 hypothetical protein FC34_GL000129 [Lacticaseibacillus brantae DSM 23927]